MSDIASALLDFVGAAGLHYGEPECCGIITAEGDVVQLPNIHPEPEKGFHIDPKAFLEQLAAGAVATWHTHPGRDPNLSEEDMNGFRAWPSLQHYIVGIRDGKPAVATFKVLEDDVVVNA
jgi:proteasome lid subunit RPN8/RPN11